jgi:hypothetical protein
VTCAGNSLGAGEKFPGSVYNWAVRRLARYVLAELAIVCCALVGAGVASQRVVSAVASAWQDRGERGLAALPPRGEISNPPELRISDEPAGTFMGMNDELLLERVRRQPIVRVKLNRGGSSLSFRLDLADGSRAAFKPAQTNLQTIPRKEVAAYRLNRLLGLNAVPPAAPRMVSRDELFAHIHPDSTGAIPRIRAETIFNPLGRTAGVIMYWIPEIRDSGLDTPDGEQQGWQWLSQAFPVPGERRAIAAQLSNLVVFDFLTSNPDRYSGGNVKMSPDGAHLYFMDNTMAFFLDPAGNDKTRPVLDRTERFSRQLYRALDRISMPGLQRELAREHESPYEILTPTEMRAVVARRDAVKKHIDDLVASYGEGRVLAFP